MVNVGILGRQATCLMLTDTGRAWSNLKNIVARQYFSENFGQFEMNGHGRLHSWC